MRILYLTEEAPFEADRSATGNQLRSARLIAGLERAGVEIEHHWQEDWTNEAIAGLLPSVRPDCLLLGYWQLAERLPDSLSLPVIADCIAPRPLEAHFVDPVASQHYIQRYLKALSRVDLMLVGNDRQRSLLAAWLLADGADLRREVPIVEVPLPIRAPARPRLDHSEPLVLATGGRQWPWRRTDGWLDQLIPEGQSGRVRLHHFGPRHASAEAEEHGLVTWQDWQDFLATRAHIGVELARPNLEREMAQPFRIASFLEAGLPVLINSCLPMAELIRAHDAGWVVDSPGQARKAVLEALEKPERWREKTAAARELAATRYDDKTCLAPLVDWLGRARKRRFVASSAGVTSASTGRLERRPSLTGMITRALLRPLRREFDGQGVVVITRSDLFPTDHGAAVKIVETARGLSAGGRAVAIVTADRGRYYRFEDGEMRERLLPAWLRLLSLPRALSHLLHRLRGLPASNAFLYWPLYDPGYGLRAAWVGRQINAATTLAEFPAYAQSARICRLFNGGRAVLAEHNVEYLRLADQVGDLSESAFERLKGVELKLANCMDAVVCVSDRDRRQLIDDGLDPANLVTIPHGVDIERFDRAEPEILAERFGLDPDRPVLAYHGTFSYGPNKQALLTSIAELLPRLAKLGYRVQLLAIGSEPPAAIDHPDVYLPGSLDHLAAPLKACDLAIVPLTSGGGTRMKILDYFAAGLAVVSTRKGCEGLPVNDGRELLIRDDWDAFARAVADLLEDDGRRRELAERGHEFARRLSWSEIAGRYDRLFRKLA